MESTQTSASQPPKADWRNIPKKKRHLQPDFHGVSGNSKLKLARPFSKKARRIITNKTKKLIKKRDELDRDILKAIAKKNPTPADWLNREKILRRQEYLSRREQHHLRKRTRKLADLDRLYRWDPSTERAVDYDLVRSLLWEFKRNLGPLLDFHGKRDADASSSDSSSEDESDDVSDEEDTKSAKRGRKSKTSVNSESSESESSTENLGGKKRKRKNDGSDGPSKKKPKTGQTNGGDTAAGPQRKTSITKQKKKAQSNHESLAGDN
ncbi:hypothetical protein F4778DRAFT_414349 [Xylariomycetidae sp. FL2044]|nr:hypothetical protein F4778DRAFT_414349 [Xylariomycetidae sp. FL2044]